MESAASASHTSPVADVTTRQRDRNIALACAVLLVVGMPIGWGTDQMLGLIVVSLVSLGLMAANVLWLVPRERAAGRESRTSLILGIVSLVSVAVFWTGLPFAVAAGAIALGLSAREAATAGRGRPTAAVVLGGIAVLLAFVALLFG